MIKLKNKRTGTKPEEIKKKQAGPLGIGKIYCDHFK
jgi:hypothetical protein